MRKRIIPVLLMLVLAVSMLAGCGKSSGGTDSAAGQTGAAASSSPDSYKGALKGVTLNVGTTGTYAPFSFYGADGKTLQGYDVDLVKALQKTLGFTIASDTMQTMDYGPLATSVSQGKLDMAVAALCVTDARKKSMNFTDTYYDAGIVVVVGKNNNTIKSADDLKGGKYKVAIQAGTVADEYAAQNLPQNCVQTFDSQSLAYKAVEGGQADATIYDAPGTAYSIKTGEVKLKIVGDEFFNGQAPYAIALSRDICKKYPNIQQNFNQAIAALKKDGTLDKLKAKWCE